MFFIFIFIFGLVVGSFLNSVIYRLKTGESILFTRSHCPHCRTILRWFDLIPVFSFVWQRGRCRYCGQKISLQYPLVEITTGILFVLIFNFQFSIFKEFSIFNFQFLNFLYYLVITCFLIIIFVFDLKHYLIPDKIIYPAILLSLLFNGVAEQSSAISGAKLAIARFATPNFLNGLSAALIAAGFFLFLVLVSKGRWMGLGDVKLAVLMGLVLGWPKILLALFVAFISGALIGLFLILAKKKTWQSQIPFGPFLSAATLVTLLFGHYLVEMIEKLI